MRKYGLHGDSRLHYGRIPFTHKYGRVFFLGLLINENNLRINLQEQERIERRIESLRPLLKHEDGDNKGQLWGSDQGGTDHCDLSPLLHDSSGFFHSLKSQTTSTQQNPHPQVTKSYEKGITILQQKLEDTKFQQSQLSCKLNEVETMLPDLVKRNYEIHSERPKMIPTKGVGERLC